MTECLQLWGGGRGHLNIEWGVGWGLEGVVCIYWHPLVANDRKQSNIFTGSWKKSHVMNDNIQLVSDDNTFYCFAFSFPRVPTAWMGGVRESLFLFFFLLTTFNLRRIMEVLMLLLEKRKEALASYLLGLMLLICLFILSRVSMWFPQAPP